MIEILVFGSNLAGRHGKGAALYARKHYGAIYGQGHGIQGYSYAIPTKNYSLQVLSLKAIEIYVKLFLSFAKRNPHFTFNVTRIGCGLAGYTNEQIAPLFKGAPANCKFDGEWWPFIYDTAHVPTL